MFSTALSRRLSGTKGISCSIVDRLLHACEPALVAICCGGGTMAFGLFGLFAEFVSLAYSRASVKTRGTAGIPCDKELALGE